jgi:protein phosphatase
VEVCQHTVAEAAANSKLRKMGTTLTMAYVLWPRLYVVHAGDSRCYLLRNRRLARMTKDHTVAQRAVDEGLMTEEQAKDSVFGNTLWNCIGGGSEGVSPDIFHATLQPGDEILLCTDGLTRKLTDRDIRDLLLKAASPDAVADALVAAANHAGGEDNITVVLARVRSSGPQDPTPADGTAVLQTV